VRLFVGIVGADGSRHLLETLEDEPFNALYKPLVRAAKLPNFIRPFAVRWLRFIGERRSAQIVGSVGSKSAYEYFDLIMDLRRYITTWLESMRKNHIDLLLVSRSSSYCEKNKASFSN
jgi:hypothetical protein